MSFILDALKKSEADRQRQSGPALFEVKVAPPRRRLPLWAVAITLLLLINVGVVLWILMRHPARAANETAAVAAAPSPAAAPPPAASAPLAVASAAPVVAPGAAAPVAPPTAAAPVPAAAAPAGGTPPPTAPAQANAAPAAPLTADHGESAGSAAAGGNPADYAPAQEPSGEAPNGRVRRGTVAGVPLYQDAAAVPGVQIPPLRLDLHVFAPHPQDRFVMINMHKVHEGDTLPEGVHVDSITPEGALLSYNGSRFLLPRD